MPDGIEIRHSNANDIAGMARLHGVTFPEPWGVAEIAGLTTPPGGAVVACLPNSADVAGFVIGRVVADEAEILSVAVARSHRRLGIARRLVEVFAAWAVERGAATVFLEVGAGNSSAIALYEAGGFVRTGIRRGYYHAEGRPPEDAILMARALSSPPKVD